MADTIPPLPSGAVMETPPLPAGAELVNKETEKKPRTTFPER